LFSLFKLFSLFSLFKLSSLFVRTFASYRRPSGPALV